MKTKKILLLSLMMVLFTSITFSQNYILNQNFEGSGSTLPTGWTKSQANGSTGWSRGYNSTIQSSYFEIPSHTKMIGANDDKCNCDASMDYVKTPIMDFTPYSSIFLSFDRYFTAGSYQDTTEEGTVEISLDGGITWDVIYTLTGDTKWITEFIDLTAYKSSSSVIIAFHYNDNGGYLYGLAVDNVKIFEPLSTDMGVTSIVMDKYVALSPQTIFGTCFNNGNATINSVDITWTVDNGNPNTCTLNGLNIASFSSDNFQHTIQWTPQSTGPHTLKVWCSNPNLSIDQNNTNDTATYSLDVVSSFSQRIVLFEEFSNASCNPCAAQNPAFVAKLQNNISKIGVIKYQTDFPGVDPMNAFNKTDVATRQNYYNVSGVPTGFMDGKSIDGTAGYDGAPVNLTQTMVDNEYDKGALFDIDVWETRTADSGFVSIRITPKYSINSNALRAFVAIVEDEIHYQTAPGTNGEKDFYWVMRKLLPGAGNLLGTVSEGVSKEFNNLKYKLDPIYDLSMLSIVVFVQDYSTKEVFQTMMTKFPGAVGLNENPVENNGFNIYPNPTNRLSTILYNSTSEQIVSISLINVLGQPVRNIYEGKLTQGNHIFRNDFSEINPGIYFISFRSENNLLVRKILITKN